MDNSYTTPELPSGESTYYRAGYIDYLSHRGTGDLCRYYQQPNATIGRDTVRRGQMYMGEAYLVSKGTVAVIKNEPGHIIVTITTSTPNRLIINQSYDPGWQIDKGRVVDADGLLAVLVPVGTTTIELTYLPPIITWAFLIGLLGVFFSCWWIRIWRYT